MKSLRNGPIIQWISHIATGVLLARIGINIGVLWCGHCGKGAVCMNQLQLLGCSTPSKDYRMA
jgi:uncharacterized membrane protein